jgi:hypothetical protein
MSRKSILTLLEGTDRRSIGQADKVAGIVSENPRLFAELITGLWSADPLVRMRTADAAEKVTRHRAELLQPYKKELLGLMAEANQQELCWHLAAMIPRLSLTAKERERAASVLHTYLKHKSSIVKTFALQGLSELTRQDLSLRPQVIEILREAAHAGTPAMKARSRRLLLQIAQD